MKFNNLGINNSIFNHFIREIRDVKIQNDSLRFTCIYLGCIDALANNYDATS